MTKLTRRAALSGASALAIAPAFAQGGRTITLMHGFTPGANVDLVARLVADNLSKRLGQTDRGRVRARAPAAPRRPRRSPARRRTAAR